MKRLVCIGLGYCAKALARRLQGTDWSVAGTARDAQGVSDLRAHGFKAVLCSGEGHEPGVPFLLPSATHLLLSAPPDAQGDAILRHYAEELSRAKRLEWIGYLSTVGVYGDRGGDWVDETAEPNPGSARTRRRLAAERAWLARARSMNVPIHIFRLAGIYGPGRNAIRNLKDGTARRIVKPGQVFNRIHVDDVAAVLQASMARPDAGAGAPDPAMNPAIYNVADDEPAPPQDVVAYAAGLLGVEPPPEMPFEAAELSAMARGFYAENRRVANARVKAALGVALAYPTYREGLQALMATEE